MNTVDGKLVTYRRADGEPIWGEYDFVLDEEFFDDLDEPIEVVKETWSLESTENVIHKPSWLDDDEQA